MRYISLFSGIEAATVGWHDFGWNPVVFADFDDFPSAVLKHHYPEVPNVGDVLKHDWKQYRGKADLIVGGSPCQSFSHAGKRLGMDDPRGNLALHYLRIVRDIQPKWFIYENVPGLLSSSEGEDFATFLDEVVKLRYGFAYRVLDAQYFGVPQRRRRVFVVGCADGDWRSAAAVLFDKESLCGNLASSKPKRQGSSFLSQASVGSESGELGRGIAFSHTQGLDCQPSTKHFPTLRAEGNGAAVSIPIHDKATRFKGGGKDRNNDGASNFLGVGNETDPMYALTTNDQHMVFQEQNDNVAGLVSKGNGEAWEIPEKHMSLTTGGGQAGQGYAAIRQNHIVRRLTPIECERLQGFPDNYTQIPWKGKPAEECPSSHRYKALGNSMAVPVMKWIGMRIDMLDSADISGRGKSKTTKQMTLWG